MGREHPVVAQGKTGMLIANPVCTTDGELPDPPANGELVDPAEPHPDEPGAPADAPARRTLERELDETD
jgi:hypothetical protein